MIVTKKIIGILTMHRINNYGSVLQAYALQEVVKRLGHNCTLIDYRYPNRAHPTYDRIQTKSFVRWLTHVVFNSLLFLKSGKYSNKKYLERFRRRYLEVTDYYPDRESLKDNPPRFDTYVLGSDQTLNIRSIGHDDIFLLAFVKEGRKISYAACAGRKRIGEEYVEMFKKNLISFDALSVRDKNTQMLVESLTGKKVVVMPDPIFLLKEKEWLKVAGLSKNIVKNKPYILVYVLGYMLNPYPFMSELINKVHDRFRYHMVIINGSRKHMCRFADSMNYYGHVSTEDFIQLIGNAAMVLTDSFHGTAFAVNFNRPFYSVYDSKSEDDRIISLLNELGLKNRGMSIRGSIPEINDKIDYADVNTRLNEMRERAFEYLRENL